MRSFSCSQAMVDEFCWVKRAWELSNFDGGQDMRTVPVDSVDGKTLGVLMCLKLRYTCVHFETHRLLFKKLSDDAGIDDCMASVNAEPCN